MGNKQQCQKLSLTLEGEALNALIGNAGAFVECNDLGMELMRNSATPIKVFLTQGQVESAFKIIETIISGPKYPNKSGKEYNGLISFRNLLMTESKRQWGN
ncbi:MAG: hypothetical protein ABW092_11985 [Candidatus Thiodiazotropha sp.]